MIDGKILLFGGSAALLLLAGCAGGSDRYPSLAVREIERTGGQFTPVEPVDPPVIRPVAGEDTLGALIARAELSHQRFLESRTQVQQLVDAARGMDWESNAKQQAFVALGDLTTVRTDAVAALGELDTLEAKAFTTFAPTAEITSARKTVAALVKEQEAILNAISEQISQ